MARPFVCIHVRFCPTQLITQKNNGWICYFHNLIFIKIRNINLLHNPNYFTNFFFLETFFFVIRKLNYSSETTFKSKLKLLQISKLNVLKSWANIELSLFSGLLKNNWIFNFHILFFNVRSVHFDPYPFTGRLKCSWESIYFLQFLVFNVEYHEKCWNLQVFVSK